MAFESASYISQLDAANPLATDPKSQGDDHLRLLKTVLKTQFPNFGTTAITATAAEVNYLSGVTSDIQTQLNAKGAKAGDTWTGNHNWDGASLNNSALAGIKTVGFFAEYDNATSGAAKTVTLANGQKQKITLSANTTLTISATGCTPGIYQLRLIQDGTGARALTWSGLSATRWLGSAAAPSINAAPNGETIVSIFVPVAGSLSAAVQSAAKVGAA